MMFVCFFVCLCLSVPKLSTVINIEANQVDLHSSDGNRSLPSVCVQYESNGRCQVGGTIWIYLHLLHTINCLSVCWFTEMEEEEHFAALGDPLHMFPGNIFSNHCCSVQKQRFRCVCMHACVFRYGIMMIRVTGAPEFAPLVTQVRGCERMASFNPSSSLEVTFPLSSFQISSWGTCGKTCPFL